MHSTLGFVGSYCPFVPAGGFGDPSVFGGVEQSVGCCFASGEAEVFEFVASAADELFGLFAGDGALLEGFGVDALGDCFDDGFGGPCFLLVECGGGVGLDGGLGVVFLLGFFAGGFAGELRDPVSGLFTHCEYLPGEVPVVVLEV